MWINLTKDEHGQLQATVRMHARTHAPRQATFH